MITKLIRKLLGRATPVVAHAEHPPEGGRRSKHHPPARGKASATHGKEHAPAGLPAPRIISAKEHKIDPHLVSRNAIKVTSTLQQAGFRAYVVGGAVRDLLLGIKPKDFDVATNATPEQVQALFRRSRIIGRRFQIVHVTFFGGREQEIIEVSTFRALVEAQDSAQVPDRRQGAKLKRGELDRHTHAVDASGRVLRDNVWGSQAEDATRRDFSVNAMYYDPAKETVHDYHGGFGDMQARTLRMIGDPASRYREDPIRILRAVRFTAKTGFQMDAATRAPIPELGDLIHNVPDSRLYDEMLKLLMSGHAWASMMELRKVGLQHGLLPLLDVILEQPTGAKFVRAALDNTDTRVQAGKPVSPGFLFASLLWPEVALAWQQRKKQGELPIPALHTAMDDVLAAQAGKLAIQKRQVGDMKDIWSLQPRFEKRSGRNPVRLLENPRFRAGYDFLLLRSEAGECPAELGQWWTDFQTADGTEREAMVAALSTVKRPARKSATKQTGAQAAGTADALEEETGDDEDEDFAVNAEATVPATKRRRRRRGGQRNRQGGEKSGTVPPTES